MICLSTVQMNAMDVYHNCFDISEVATIKCPFQQNASLFCQRNKYIIDKTWNIFPSKLHHLNHRHQVHNMLIACLTIYHEQFCTNYCESLQKTFSFILESKNWYIFLRDVFLLLNLKLLLSSMILQFSLGM